jgi:hypothetical protein
MATVKKARKPTPPATIKEKPILSMSRGVGQVKSGPYAYSEWSAARMTIKVDEEYKTRQIVLYAPDERELVRFAPDEIDFWRDFFVRAAEVYGNGDETPAQ